MGPRGFTTLFGHYFNTLGHHLGLETFWTNYNQDTFSYLMFKISPSLHYPNLSLSAMKELSICCVLLRAAIAERVNGPCLSPGDIYDF